VAGVGAGLGLVGSQGAAAVYVLRLVVQSIMRLGYLNASVTHPHPSIHPPRPQLPEEPNGDPAASAAYATADAAARAAGAEELSELRLIAPPGSALVPAKAAGGKGASPGEGVVRMSLVCVPH